jgi:hypothetical protein
MAPRMVFRMSIRRSVSAPIRSEPKSTAEPNDPESYPVGTGVLSVRHVPIHLIVEDNVALDYLLCFSRREFSSEPVELLFSHREMERERARLVFGENPLHVRELLSELINAHVAENASMQVTLPTATVNGLREWLQAFDAAAPPERGLLALPAAELTAAVKQCMVRARAPHLMSSTPRLPFSPAPRACALT